MTVLQFGLHLILEGHHLPAHLVFRTSAGEKLVSQGAAPAAPILQRFGTVEIFKLSGGGADGIQSPCHRKRNDRARVKLRGFH